MPRYDYACPCGRTTEAWNSIKRRHANAPQCCGKRMRITVGEGPAVHVFKPMWAENLDSEPIYITSKRQYKEEATRRGKIVVDLL